APVTTTTTTSTTTTTTSTTTTTTTVPPPAGGLIASYNSNETAGPTLTGHTGTVASGAWTTAGHTAGALTFNGTSTMVTVADATDLHLTTGMTVEAWVRPTATLNALWCTVVLKERTNGLSYALYGNGDNRRASGYINTG